MAQPNPFDETVRKDLQVGENTFHYYSLPALNDERVDKLPYCVRVLLESALRNCDEFTVKKDHIETILNWHTNAGKVEIPFKPARVLLQDFTGVPAVVDLAAMRDGIKRLGGDPSKINPIVPADLVIDHSVQVDFAGTAESREKNEETEFRRNRERFQFLKWGSKSFENFRIVPPGSGIVHQVNLEYLARVVFNTNNVLYPDSLVGTDSHSTMIDSLGVAGWGVGGIEAEAVMLGQHVSMVLPEVVGYKLTGKLPDTSTATDLVLTIVKNLRDLGVVGKFVEFYGDGVQSLSLADRATISNMSPEYGATMGFFAVDEETLRYLRTTGRTDDQLAWIEQYLRVNNMFQAYDKSAPVYTHNLELDLATVVACMAGPKRPHDRVSVTDMKKDFADGLTAKVGFKGFGLDASATDKKVTIDMDGKKVELSHGSVCIAAITSCTNTSNPAVMLGAALLARNAVKAGLSVEPYVKMSLSPGSGVVSSYLEKSGMQPYLDQLGFNVVGFGCMTCIGNSGPLDPRVSEAINDNDLVVAGVLSGNRNFEGRIHSEVRANYLASPPLVVAYALAGRVTIDFESEPLGQDADGKDVFLRDIWPAREEIDSLIGQFILPQMFTEVYQRVTEGTDRWNSLETEDSQLYAWQPDSTYVRLPPFFETMGLDVAPPKPIEGAYVLLNVGDSITTDHISPAGSIARSSPAARYLQAHDVDRKDFNTYGSRRGNHEVMMRGTFANIRLVNKFIGKAAPKTIYTPTKEVMDVWDAAERHINEGHQLIVLGGSQYGSGSSRDWAAKGPFLQGVKAVIAVSYERIHRSNLVGMGIVPLQFKDGESADTLGLTGLEQFTIHLPENMTPGQDIKVSTNDGKEFTVVSRFDTEIELVYYENGGILQYVLRNLAKA